MKTPAIWTAFCLGLAPWAAASQSPATTTTARSTPAVVFSPIELNATVGTTAATPSEGQKGMLGIYLAQDDERALVDGLVPGGAAEKTGLQAGDRITAVNGEPVGGWRDVGQRVGSHQAGESLKVTVERDGWTKEFTVVLGAAPDAPAVSSTVPAPAAPRLADALEAPIEKQKAEKQKAEKQAVEKQAKKSKSVAGQVRVQKGSEPMVLGLKEDEEGNSGELRQRVIELKRQVEGDGVEQKDSDSKSCCGDGACCPGCCKGSGSGSVSGVLGVAPEGTWTIDLDHLTDELPTISSDGVGQVLVAPHGQKGVEMQVEGVPLKLRSGVLHRVDADGENKQVHVYRVDGDDSPVRVEVKVEKDGDGADGSGARVFQNGEWHEFPGAGVFRVEGGDGAHGMRVFRGDVEPRSGSDAHEDAGDEGARRRSDLSELREELENLRQELRDLRQALHRVQANGGTR